MYVNIYFNNDKSKPKLKQSANKLEFIFNVGDKTYYTDCVRERKRK